MSKKLDFNPDLDYRTYDSVQRAFIETEIESSNERAQKMASVFKAVFNERQSDGHRTIYGCLGIMLGQFLGQNLELDDESIDACLAEVKKYAQRLRDGITLDHEQRNRLERLASMTGMSPEQLAEAFGVKIKKPVIEVEDRTDPDLD